MSVPLMSFTTMPTGAGAFEDCMNPIGGGTKNNVLHKKASVSLEKQCPGLPQSSHF